VRQPIGDWAMQPCGCPYVRRGNFRDPQTLLGSTALGSPGYSWFQVLGFDVAGGRNSRTQ
jgi:hypothetical protein